MTTNRADVERIVEGVLSNLRMVMERSHFTDPNSRTIALKLGDKTITTVTFDVKDTSEYEG